MTAGEASRGATAEKKLPSPAGMTGGRVADCCVKLHPILRYICMAGKVISCAIMFCVFGLLGIWAIGWQLYGMGWVFYLLWCFFLLLFGPVGVLLKGTSHFLFDGQISPPLSFPKGEPPTGFPLDVNYIYGKQAVSLPKPLEITCIPFST